MALQTQQCALGHDNCPTADDCRVRRDLQFDLDQETVQRQLAVRDADQGKCEALVKTIPVGLKNRVLGLFQRARVRMMHMFIAQC